MKNDIPEPFQSDFDGCKLAMIHNDKLLVYKRDNIPGIRNPGMWDLPGGGREGEETPEQCVLRELHEEFGLRFPAERLIYRRRYRVEDERRHVYFFASRLRAREIEQISFGSEGQYWRLMALTDYLEHPLVPGEHKQRVREFLYPPN